MLRLGTEKLYSQFWTSPGDLNFRAGIFIWPLSDDPHQLFRYELYVDKHDRIREQGLGLKVTSVGDGASDSDSTEEERG